MFRSINYNSYPLSIEIYFRYSLSTVCGPWSGRKRRKWVFLILEEEWWAELCPLSCRDILLTCDQPTASELCRKSYIIENDCYVWFLHGAATLVPSRYGHFGRFVSRHGNCAQKETFQAPSDLAWNSSDCFESFSPLKIKFLYIFYKHHLNFETKMRFLCEELKFGLLKKLFSHLCECVSYSYDATSAKSPPF